MRLDRVTRLTPKLYEYLVRHGHNDDPLLAKLAEETERLGPIAVMQIAPEQGTLLSILVLACGARSAIEIGTFTGYSAICIARGLPADGQLHCCDISEEWTAIVRRYFVQAGVADRITLHIRPAIESLRDLRKEHPFDFAFIDADKVSYRAYYEAVLPLMRPNGLMVFDNVLWMGRVLKSRRISDETRALRELNDVIAQDQRVQAVMINVSDGLTIVRKKSSNEQ